MAQSAHASSVDTPIIERWTLVATIVASSMAFIDLTALNVALPALQSDLNATGADLFWVVSAYSIFLAALILVGGSLGDHLGRKRVFTAGVILFTLASLACGAAPSVGFILIARAVQGIGGALMVPGSLAILSAIFPSERRGVAIGTWSTFSTITTIAGPVIGGLLASRGFWRGIFFINLPLAAVVLYALLRVPETRDEQASAQFDVPGIVLATLGLGGITYGFLQGPGLGFSDPQILTALIGGVAALVAFVLVEARSPHPMMRLSLFKSRTFSGTNLLTLFLYAALNGVFFFVALNLIQAQGYSADYTAYALLPFSFMLALLSRWAGGLASRIGPRILLIIGPALTGLSFFLYGLIGLTNGPADYWLTFFPATLLSGLGMGLTVAPLTTAVMGSAPPGSTGTASGINNAVARTAGVLAIAIFGAIALLAFSSNLDSRASSLNLPAPAQAELRAEAPNFGNAAPPADLPEEQQARVAAEIKLAFVDTFRLLMFISAALAWISALMAALLVEKPSAAPAVVPATTET